jgi:uncharacterized repeat protein (TIGR01451 family)
MSFDKRAQSTLVKFIYILIAIAALYGVGAYVLPTLQLKASYADLAPLTFKSPVGNPELRIRKTVDDEAPEPGDVIEYTLAYSTTIPETEAFNVRLYDFLPAGLEFVSSTPPGLHSDGVVLFTAESVGPETQVARVRASVLPGHKELRNHALVLADAVTPAHDSLSTSVTQLPVELRLDKLGYSAVLVGDELIYKVRCENDSENPVDYVTLIDILPGDVELVAVSPPPDQQDPFLRWTLPYLAPWESFEATITSTAPSATGVITNVALGGALQRVLSQELFATQVVTEGAILRVEKAHSAPVVDLDDELHYTLKYENAGNVAVSGVVLTDTLPLGVSVMSISPSPTVSTTGYLRWDLGSVGPEDPMGTITITVVVDRPGPRYLHNVVDITGQPGSFSGHDEEWTWVRPAMLYLPVVFRFY